MPSAIDSRTNPALQGLGLFFFALLSEKNKKNILRELCASNERSEWAVKQNNNMSLLSHSED
jgi:hypothetical protein